MTNLSSTWLTTRACRHLNFHDFVMYGCVSALKIPAKDTTSTYLHPTHHDVNNLHNRFQTRSIFKWEHHVIQKSNKVNDSINTTVCCQMSHVQLAAPLFHTQLSMLHFTTMFQVNAPNQQNHQITTTHIHFITLTHPFNCFPHFYRKTNLTSPVIYVYHSYVSNDLFKNGLTFRTFPDNHRCQTTFIYQQSSNLLTLWLLSKTWLHSSNLHGKPPHMQSSASYNSLPIYFLISVSIRTSAKHSLPQYSSFFSIHWAVECRQLPHTFPTATFTQFQYLILSNFSRVHISLQLSNYLLTAQPTPVSKLKKPNQITR